MPLNPGASSSNISVGTLSIGSISGIDSTVAVYFDPASPSVSASFSAASLEVTPTTGSRILYDLGHQAVRTIIAGTSAAASLQVVGITNSIAVHVLTTGGTMAVNVGKTDGTVTVRLDPGYELGSVKGINSTVGVFLTGTAGTQHVYLDPGTTLEGIQSSVAVHILSTNGTMAVNVGKVDGTVAVFFSPGTPAVATTLAGTIAAVPTTGSGDPIYEETGNWQRVLIAGSQAAASLQVSGITSTVGVHLGSTGGTLAIKIDPDYNTVAATFSASSLEVTPTTGSRILYDLGHQAVRTIIAGTSAAASIQVTGITNTIGVFLTGTAGTQHVYLDPGTTLEGIQSSVAVHVGSTGGTLAIKIDPDHNVVAATFSASSLEVVPTSGSRILYDLGHQAVRTIIAGTSAAASLLVSGITNSIAVHVGSTGGTIHVKLDPAGTAFTNAGHTASIFTVAGSTAGVSASGVQLVAPSANAAFKVFAFSLQTTGIVSTVARFTNGGGTATEFWRGLVTANQTSSTPIGANLAVTPPGFLFSTGVSTTLALHLDNATLVHYSVSYFKETA